EAETEETLARIQAQKSVIGTILVNSKDKKIIYLLYIQYAGQLHQLITVTRNTVREIDPQNQLTFFLIRSKKHEIMIGAGKMEENQYYN
uniref:Roadblock/LAMTOR2 domain-containing protein n=1 Tax=Scleropages formosus TaxID=113540 RepID=A0A8C9RFK8_SCLFO